MSIFKNKFRIQLHSDKEGFPDCWYIQKKSWWQNDYRFMVGYFPTWDDANEYMESCFFNDLKGVVHPPESMSTYHLKDK